MWRSTKIYSLPALLASLTMVAQSQPQPPTVARSVEMQAPKARLRLEIAQNEAARERGLMFRTKLAPHTGMLFVFERDDAVTFWMKNTLISLDIVFVGADGRVRSLSARVPATAADAPDAAIPRRSGHAKYVLELPAGEAALDGLRPGARLKSLPARF